MIIAGVVGAVVLVGALVLLSSDKKKVVQPREERAPPPKAAVVPRDWFAVGRNEGADWARHTQRRGSMAGGDGDPFAEDTVLRMADDQTSNHYNKGLRNNAAGEKRYIEGFVAGVKAGQGQHQSIGSDADADSLSS